MKLKEFRKHRNMPFIKRGMRVLFTYDGRKGRIAGANENSNLNIIFDGENRSVNCHPFFKMQYFDKQGKLIKEYKDPPTREWTMKKIGKECGE